MAAKTLRVLGVDAGVHCGVAVLDVDLARGMGSFIHCGILDAGDRIGELRRMLNDEPFHPLVAFEIPSGVVYERDRRGAPSRPAMTKHLVEAAGIGRELRGVALALGFEVATATAGEVRAALCGRNNADDAAVESMLRLRCPTWPAPRKTTNHERDAGAVAIFAALRPARWFDRQAERFLARRGKGTS